MIFNQFLKATGVANFISKFKWRACANSTKSIYNLCVLRTPSPTVSSHAQNQWIHPLLSDSCSSFWSIRMRLIRVPRGTRIWIENSSQQTINSTQERVRVSVAHKNRFLDDGLFAGSIASSMFWRLFKWLKLLFFWSVVFMNLSSSVA